MLEFSILLALTITISVWSIASGGLYRNPFLLIIIGLTLSLYGAFITTALNTISSNSFFSKLFESLPLSSAIINYTIAAAGGSLIASGIVLKAQALHEKEKRLAKKNLYRLLREYQQAKQQEEDPRKRAKDLDDHDFKIKLTLVQERKIKSINELQKAKFNDKHLLEE